MNFFKKYVFFFARKVFFRIFVADYPNVNWKENC